MILLIEFLSHLVEVPLKGTPCLPNLLVALIAFLEHVNLEVVGLLLKQPDRFLVQPNFLAFLAST